MAVSEGRAPPHRARHREHRGAGPLHAITRFGFCGPLHCGYRRSVAIAPATRMGPVELSVSDLDRSLEYWQRTVGLPVLARENGTAALGADRELIRFVEEPGAIPADGFT